MGIASSLMGAVAGGAARIGALGPAGLAAAALSFIPFITDLIKGDPEGDAEKKLLAYRDSQAAQLAGSTGMPLDKAIEQISNGPLKDALEAVHEASGGGGKTAIDLGSAALDLGITGWAGGHALAKAAGAAAGAVGAAKGAVGAGEAAMRSGPAVGRAAQRAASGSAARGGDLIVRPDNQVIPDVMEMGEADAGNGLKDAEMLGSDTIDEDAPRLGYYDGPRHGVPVGGPTEESGPAIPMGPAGYLTDDGDALRNLMLQSRMADIGRMRGSMYGQPGG